MKEMIYGKTVYPERLIFTDAQDNNCMIESTDKTISLVTSGEARCVELTENQANDLIQVLNFWVKNKKLSAGEIKFQAEAPSSALSIR